jgi:two-component system, NtrC family, sensor kinase
MDAKRAALFDSAPGLRRPFAPSSIVWKMTLFVGVLVALFGGLLIGVAFFFTSRILRDQIHERLSTLAGDRQEILATTLRQLEERAVQFAKRSRINQLLGEHNRGHLTQEQFRDQAEVILSNTISNTTGLLAAWLEDTAGHRLALVGSESLIAAYSQRRRPVDRTAGGVMVPPVRIGETYGMVFFADVRGNRLESVGRVLLLFDFAPTAGFLTDPHGLGETGEVLVGIAAGEMIHLVLPYRQSSSRTDLSKNDLPPLAQACSGQFGFVRTTDDRGNDILVAYRPVGRPYENWGLIAKIDSAEAYKPVGRLRSVLLALGGVALLLGLLASNVIARQVARPIRRLARTAAAVASGDYSARTLVKSNDEIGALSKAFNRMTEDLSRSYGSLERKISDRTHELEAVRDLLDAFFRISTSRQDPDNIEKTFDSVLRFCAQLGYELAMISLVQRDAGVIRAVRGTGAMSGLVELTVRPLDGDDILAVVVRENRMAVVPDSRLDPHCDQKAIALSGIRGQVILPLASEEVLGTLQVASSQPLDPAILDIRPLNTLAMHTARALTGLRQLEEIRRLNQTLEEHASELARSETALREQTHILESVLVCMGDGVVVADRDGRFLVFNPAAERIVGLGRMDAPPAEWSQRYQIYLPDRVTPYPVTDLPLVRAIRGESVDQAELYIAYPSRDAGTYILVTGRPLRDEEGQLQGGVIVFHDITRRKRGERRLAAQYETTRVLAEAESPSQAYPKILETICESLNWDLGAFWRVDTYTQRLRCATLWRRPSMVLTRFEALTQELSLERDIGLPGRVWACGQSIWISEFVLDSDLPRQAMAKEGGLHAAFAVPVLLRGDCLGVIEFVSHEARQSDEAVLEMMANLGTQIGQFIERHQMRGRVVQSEKLASLGMLSAGVAHEINNPLAYVANNIAVLERDVRVVLTILRLYEQAAASLAETERETAREIDRIAAEFDLAYVKNNMGKLLESTRQGIKRVADIVQNLRGFARVDRASFGQADIHEALRTALEMVHGRMERRAITVEQRLGDLPSVSGSPALLNQVFLNLLVNAMQAIDATHRLDGRIAITTEARNGEVVIEVADNGCGIPDDVLPQIFDPFFTTKAIGDGTGLGLSITHAMVSDHGGRMEVESASGQGSRFRVILPLARPGS